MHLKSIQITNFRNWRSMHVEPNSGMNVFVGPNGHGKTNLLDAIALGSQLRCVRSVKQNSDLILFGESFARVETEFENLKVSISITQEGKKLKINGKPTRDSHALAEKVAVVSFVPEDLGAVLGGASLRRKLLDQLAASLFPSYISYYKQYERVLQQRNRLLKQPMIDWSELDSFTTVLSGLAHSIEEGRKQALEQLKPLFEANMLQLSDGKLLGALSYTPSSGADLKTALDGIRSEERARKVTVLGPHVDDLEIQLNKHPARSTASRGQARVLILAFKIAQLQTVHAKRSLNPILLLDDVVGELDPKHASLLLEAIRVLHGQTFVTTTEQNLLKDLKEAQTKAIFQ